MSPKYVSQPPPSKRGKYDRGPWHEHQKMVAALKKKPGQWLNVKTFGSYSAASRFASLVRTNSYIAFSDAQYEAKVVGKDVYARLVV